MRTILTIIASFILTTLFWFSVPTVRQIAATNYLKDAKESVANQEPQDQLALAVALDEKTSEFDEQKKAYEKRIKDLESQLKKANANQPASSPAKRETTDLAVSSSAATSVNSTNTPTKGTTTQATTEQSKVEKAPEEQSLSIVGTWAYDNPQTSEEREHQLIFNAYGAFKYYDTYAKYTLRNFDYTTKGNTLKIGYNTGTYKLSRVNGVDYLEISGIKDYAGKLRRVR